MQYLKSLLLLNIAAALLSFTFPAQNTTYPFEVKISGKGNEAIIFIPGFASSGEVWSETRDAFEKDYTCYTLTMEGFAGVPRQGTATFEKWEKAIAAFIQQKKINKPIIIGHSMGGALAMALAADFPDLISKIVVVDALPCLPALMNPSFQAKKNNDCSKVVAQITTLSEQQFLQMQNGSVKQLVADTTKQALVVSWSLKSDKTTFAEMYCDFSNTDLRDKIKTIECPALILLESYFINFKPSINEQFKNLKTANIQYATKGLHFIMYDDKEWYTKQLHDFIKLKKHNEF